MRLIPSLLAFVFASTTFAFGQEVPIVTANGTASIERNPQPLVVLDLAAIDTLDALGIKADGVPAMRPPKHLKGAIDGVQTVGSMFEPDYEALAVLGPDLIVAGGRSQRLIGDLDRIAPTIDMTIWGSAVIEQAIARTIAYGTLFDRGAEASDIIDGLNASLSDAKSAVSGKGDALIILTNGGKVSAYGDDSRFGWLHTELGLPEAFADITAENHGEAVSFEFIAEVNPDWLLVIDRAAAVGRGGEAAAATLDTPLVQDTTAGQLGQIVYLDSAALYLAAGGVQATTIILEQIATEFRKASPIN